MLTQIIHALKALFLESMKEHITHTKRASFVFWDLSSNMEGPLLLQVVINLSTEHTEFFLIPTLRTHCHTYLSTHIPTAPHHLLSVLNMWYGLLAFLPRTSV